MPADIIGGFVFVYFVSIQLKVSSSQFFFIFRPIKPLLCASFVPKSFPALLVSHISKQEVA